MINLLPQFTKKKLMSEYRLRAGVIVLWGILAMEILAALLLLPSYHLINVTAASLNEQLAAKKALAPEGGEDAQKKIALIKSEALLLSPPVRPSDLPISQILGEILAQKPAGVAVSSFAYGRVSASAVSAQLSGIAGTREDLLAFQHMLKDNPHFSDIKYAQSFITRKTDIDFQLTVTVK